MFVRIDHVEIIPQDFERSLKFYQEVIGFKLEQRMELNFGPVKEIAYLKLGDGVIEIINFDNPGPAAAGPSISYCGMALEVQSMDAAIADLKEKGVDVVWGPMDLGGSIRAEIRDPDGLTIELREWQSKPW